MDNVLIGELAGRSGVPTKTIRYYEDVGLLTPPGRTSGGYRKYGPEAAGRLGFIRAAQSVGLSLGEIREILAFRDRGKRPCAHVTALIESRASDLSERIHVLERMRRDLEKLARRARRTAPSQAAEATYCHILESQLPAHRRA